MNDHGGARFQRSQSQNDLDRQTHDDRFFDPKDLRSSASGYNIQGTDLHHEADRAVRRHPSDVGDRYRRSYGELDAPRMPPSAANGGNISWTDALVLRHQQTDQKLRTPSDPSRNVDSSWRDDRKDHGYQRDYDARRLHSAGDDFRRSHENTADVSAALSKKASVRTENPKNQDIINWLQLGDGSSPQPHVADANPDGRDINRSASNYRRSTTNRPEDQPASQAGFGTEPGNVQLPSPRSYAAARSDGDVGSGRMDLRNSLTSGPRADREGTSFLQFGVSNPAYYAGHHASVSDQTQSSDTSVRGREPGYVRGLLTFSNSRQNSDRPHDRSSQGPVRSMDYASSGDQSDALSRGPPTKPVHTTFSNSPLTHGWDHSAGLPPVLPPKLASQQVPLKPPHVSPGQSDQYRRPAEAPSRSLTTDAQLRVIKDDASDRVTSPSEYAVVYKRPVQSVAYDRAVDEPTWRDDVNKLERPGADGEGYPSDGASRSRQSPDGTHDSSRPLTSKSNPTIQPLGAHVTSSSDFSNDQRPGVKASSPENLASSPPGRPPLPSDDVLAASGLLANLSAPTRSEPQGGAENANLQVSMLFSTVSSSAGLNFLRP